MSKEPKFKIKRTFVGKPEDAQRLVKATLRLLNLDKERAEKRRPAA